MDELEFIKDVMRVFYDADDTDGLFWNFHGGTLNLFAQCSDIFWWATADCEAILPEDLPLLHSCLGDVMAIEKSTGKEDRDIHKHDFVASCYLAPLFASRKRGMRPQRPVFKDLGPKLVELFNACGPERDPKSEG